MIAIALPEGRENLIVSLFSKEQGVPRNITKINRLRLLELVEDDRLQTILTPYMITASHIVRSIRAMQSGNQSELEALYIIADGKVEALVFQTNESSGMMNIPIKDLNIPKYVIIAAIIRDNRILFPNGQDEILVGDRVVIVTTRKGYHNLKSVISNPASKGDLL